MKSQMLGGLVAFGLAVVPNGMGQGFVNLGFENATINTVSFPGGDRYTATVPGWSVNTFNYLNGDPNSVGFNDIALDSPAVTLHGTNSPFVAPIGGRYSVLLQGGTFAGGMVVSTNGASIFQTGQVSLAWQSLLYSGGAAIQVAFNGLTLPSVALSNAASYTVWGVDVSGYAGQTGELRFTAPWQSTSAIDNIQFSITPVPEPNMLALGGVLVVVLCGNKIASRKGSI